MEAATASTAVETSASVTAVLTECWIWRESKTYESRKRDQGSKKTKSSHNLSVPSSVEAHRQSRSLRIGKALSNQILADKQELPQTPLLAETPATKDATPVPIVSRKVGNH